MDPDEALKNLRTAIKAYQQGQENCDTEERLLVAASALDDWMSKGGHPPLAWGEPHLILGLEIPRYLKPKAQGAAEAIVEFLRSHTTLVREDYRVFYTPGEMAARGETEGLKSLLLVCHGEGPHGRYFRAEGLAALNAYLRPAGYYAEPCLGWYSAIYPLSVIQRDE